MSINNFDLSSLVRKNILHLTPYSSARSEFKGKASIFLDANENPFDNGYNRYPDPLQWELKDKISTIWNVPSSSIFLGNGSDEPIDLLIRLFCEPGKDHIIITAPTYGMYRVGADIAGVEVKEVLLTTDFQLNIDLILDQTNANSKILFLCSPNNPTGNSLQLEDVLKIIASFPGIVVVDEAYIDFSDSPGLLPILADFPNLVILQTFSKAWGLAGIRLGMAFASKSIIDFLNKIKSPYNLNTLTLTFMLEQVERLNAKNDAVTLLKKERNALVEKFKSYPFIQKIYPSDANFILIKVENASKLYNFFVSKGIIVRNRTTMPLCEGGIRITVGKPSENINLLVAMDEWQLLNSTI